MQLTIEREKLLKPLQLVAGVVERRQTLPILANVLFSVKNQILSLVGTDLEIELKAHIEIDGPAKSGSITTPARKLMDICRVLPEKSQIEIHLDGGRLSIKAGRSRFNLVTLPAEDFPATDEHTNNLEFTVPKVELRKLFDNTAFAMAQQDVRYYLNGMLVEVGNNCLRSIATDGHRMALNTMEVGANIDTTQVIIPRKSVLEMTRLLSDLEGEVNIGIGTNQLRFQADDYVFTTKLIDGRFPSYDKVIPKGGDKILIINRDILKQALARVAILANDRHHGVRLELRKDLLRVSASNPEQEEAEEELSLDYKDSELEIGFNIHYLLDIVNALPAGDIKLTFIDSESSALLEAADSKYGIYVIMPMRL